jgi:hypothetical protein
VAFRLAGCARLGLAGVDFDAGFVQVNFKLVHGWPSLRMKRVPWKQFESKMPSKVHTILALKINFKYQY